MTRLYTGINCSCYICVADAPELPYEHSWDGFNYSTNSGRGSRGIITFHKEFFLAGFRNKEFPSNYFSARDYFVQAPEKVIELAENETLQYLLEDVNGNALPLVTTVLWGDKDQVFLCHSFDDMIERGGDLLKIHSLNPNVAFEACKENYEFTEQSY